MFSTMLNNIHFCFTTPVTLAFHIATGLTFSNASPRPLHLYDCPVFSSNTFSVAPFLHCVYGSYDNSKFRDSKVRTITKEKIHLKELNVFKSLGRKNSTLGGATSPRFNYSHSCRSPYKHTFYYLLTIWLLTRGVVSKLLYSIIFNSEL